jgi:hypothetical protein
MVATELESAVSTIAAFLAAQPESEQAVRARWHAGEAHASAGLPPEVIAAADRLAATVPPLTMSDAGVEALAEILASPGAATVLSFLSASAWRADLRVAPVLQRAAARPELAARAAAVAGDRIVAGPRWGAGCGARRPPSTR